MNVKHNDCYSPEYESWAQMRKRCRNNKHKAYKNYGGRGITICKEWDDYSVFLADMGRKPFAGAELDRIDNEGNYMAENCRWVTAKDNSKNRRTTVYITLNNITKPLSDWAETLGIGKTTLHYRISQGWSLEEALSSTKIKGRTTRSSILARRT